MNRERNCEYFTNYRCKIKIRDKYKPKNTGVINTPTNPPRDIIVAVPSNYDSCKSGVYFGFSSYCAPYKEIRLPVDKFGGRIYQTTARILTNINIR